MADRNQPSSKRRSTRRRLLNRCGFAVLLLSAATHPAAGQAIPKPEYVTYLPREIVLPVQATPANRQFHLFGDSTTPGCRDAAPRDGIDVDQILKNADLAMYAAKSAGRRTHRFFEPAMDAQVRARRVLEVDLRQAISDGAGRHRLVGNEYSGRSSGLERVRSRGDV